MRTLAACLAVALASALASPAAAFPIGTQDYASNQPFIGGIENLANGMILSGSLNATFAAAQGPYIFLNTTGFVVSGIGRACWWIEGQLPVCTVTASPQLRVTDGGSVGLQLPRGAEGTIASAHSLVFFVDVGRTLSYPGVEVTLGRDIAAKHVGGTVSFTSLPAIPATPAHEMAANNAAGIMLLDDRTRIQVVDGATTHLSGAGLAITFQGTPAIAPFGLEASVSPFPVGSVAQLQPAEAEAAQLGVDLSSIMAFGREAESALGSGASASDAPVENQLAEAQSLLGSILDGALLSVPANALGQVEQPAGEQATPDIAAILGNVTFLRFNTLTATANAEGTVTMEGSGPLQIQAGRVVGAPSLLGVMPWWCWLLWVAALGMWIARLVLKPAKEHEKWDKLGWVGWVAAPVVALFVIWLWDGQVYNVWGLSLMRGGGGGIGTIFLLLTEVVIGLLVYLAVVMPMSSLLKSGARFAKQGRFMGLHRPVAMVLGYLLGATLLLSYIDLIIGMFA